MSAKELVNAVIERLSSCQDADLLDLILKLLIESGN